MERRHFLKTGAAVMGAIPFVSLSSAFFQDLLRFNDKEVYNLQFGRGKVTIFRDYIYSYTADDFFLNVPQEELEKALENNNINRDNMPSPFNVMLLQFGDHKILMDTGIGYAEKPIMIGSNPFEKKGKLQHLLASENIKNEEITDVVISHFHPDHIGGIYNEEKALVFPKAKYHAPKEEWDYWHSPKADNQSPFFKSFVADQVTPLKNEDLHLFSGDYTEVLPGITAVQAQGHTPGHVAFAINSEKENLLFVSDAFLHPLHVERLDWQTKYDLDHAKARQSREKVLDLAYRENMLVNAFHFDFPGLGRIEKANNIFKWQNEI